MKYIKEGTEFIDQLKDKVHDLYDENKLLQDMDKILRNENTNLKLEIKKQTDYICDLVSEKVKLQEKINKAIEYIEQNEWYTKLRKTFINDLLDILKGEDK